MVSVTIDRIFLPLNPRLSCPCQRKGREGARAWSMIKNIKIKALELHVVPLHTMDA
jgi:hypothetical protein